jgi:hypothetical protein
MSAEDKMLISKKKPSYPVSDDLRAYLREYNRETKIPIFYEDLLRFSGSIVVYDKEGEDTLWIRVFYQEFERKEIDSSLKKIYSLLYSDGTTKISDFLSIDAIDYCTFGNSKPFRVKIRNILNDNHVHFYVKKADASRIYGLELEHILSPNRINFLVHEDTLIEEHITGIPGDEFIKTQLKNCDEHGKSLLAKEFVKFNERCMMRLLGDMRSYNYVIVPIHDFDHVVYKFRAIDFDQQCYEGKFRLYRPQFYKENATLVKLVSERLQESSVEQYKNEERALLAKRILSTNKRIRTLIACMEKDTISTPEKMNQLKMEIYEFTRDIKFKACQSMGEVLRASLEFVKRNYENVSAKDLER